MDHDPKRGRIASSTGWRAELRSLAEALGTCAGVVQHNPIACCVAVGVLWVIGDVGWRLFEVEPRIWYALMFWPVTQWLYAWHRADAANKDDGSERD